MYKNTYNNLSCGRRPRAGDKFSSLIQRGAFPFSSYLGLGMIPSSLALFLFSLGLLLFSLGFCFVFISPNSFLPRRDSCSNVGFVMLSQDDRSGI